MSEKETKPGAVDDPAIAGRATTANEKKKKMLQDIFDDNTTGRPQHPDKKGS